MAPERRSQLARLQEQSRWLSRHAANITSQFGEDGIIAKALSLLPERTSWCVEAGAADGKQDSNTYDLITSHDYRGVLIESDPVSFRDLAQRHGGSARHMLLNAVVGFSPADSLDALLSTSDIPTRFDLLSIDVDGNDYYVWEATRQYRPALVLIEFNPTLSNATLFVQKPSHETNQGASPAALVELGARKGYELVAVTAANLLFVAEEYYPAFGIADNSLALIRDDGDIPRIFVGYDGHVFLSQGSVRGAIDLPWHGLTLNEADVQVLPPSLEKYRDRYAPGERLRYVGMLGLKNPRRFLGRLQPLWLYRLRRRWRQRF